MKFCVGSFFSPKKERREFYNEMFRKKAQQRRCGSKLERNRRCCANISKKNISEARRTREIRKRGKKAVERQENEIEEICEKLKN